LSAIGLLVKNLPFASRNHAPLKAVNIAKSVLGFAKSMQKKLASYWINHHMYVMAAFG